MVAWVSANLWIIVIVIAGVALIGMLSNNSRAAGISGMLSSIGRWILGQQGMAGLAGNVLEVRNGNQSFYAGPPRPIIAAPAVPVYVVPAAQPQVYYQQQAAAPAAAPAAVPAATPTPTATTTLTPAAIPAPNVGQTGAAGTPVVISGGANDLFVRWRKDPGAWSGWYTVSTLPGGVLTLNVGAAAPVQAGDIVVAQFCRGTQIGADSAPWTAA